jgi:hypothetical protein
MTEDIRIFRRYGSIWLEIIKIEQGALGVDK